MSKYIVIDEIQGFSDIHAQLIAAYLVENNLAAMITSEFQRQAVANAIESGIQQYVFWNGVEATDSPKPIEPHAKTKASRKLAPPQSDKEDKE